MLVLSRQRDESVIIGEGEEAIRIKVVDIRGDKVRHSPRRSIQQDPW
jgi:sRNA-binding carbon storage regulator CsrA